MLWYFKGSSYDIELFKEMLLEINVLTAFCILLNGYHVDRSSNEALIFFAYDNIKERRL